MKVFNHTFRNRAVLAAGLLFSSSVFHHPQFAIAQDCVPSALLATLNNPAPAAGDYFGGSVAISGNLVVVGANYDDPGGVTWTGTAYVFDATTGALVATLNNPAPNVSDHFGYPVAISGNLVVVGAGAADSGGVTDAGTAYVFDATTGALVATLNNPAQGTNDYFGNAVAISGNLAVVGAWRNDPNGVADAGTAYVFNATTGALVATLNNPAPAPGDYFGFSAAISGNLAVIGAWRDDPGGVTDAGTAYVFNATTGALVATLNNPAPAAGDYFGFWVAISGNLAVVGANGDSPGGILGAGTAYVFNATTGALVATLNNPARIVKILPYLAEKQNSLNLQRLCEGGFCGVEAVGGRLSDRSYRPVLHRAG